MYDSPIKSRRALMLILRLILALSALFVSAMWHVPLTEAATAAQPGPPEKKVLCPPDVSAAFEDCAFIPPGKPAAWDVVPDSPTALRGRPSTSNVGEASTNQTLTTQDLTITTQSDCLGSSTRKVRWASTSGILYLEGCGQTFTLTDVARAVDATKLELVDPANKVWFLKVKLIINEGATLNVIGGTNGDANWLRLRSDDTSGIYLRTGNGNLRLEHTKVTSWDATRNTYDTAYATAGRAYVAARSEWTSDRTTVPPTACDVNGGSQEFYEARVDVINSEVAYLGYNAAESYGITWKVYSKTPPPGRQLYDMVDIFGRVASSTFHHNYFGTYTYGGYCMNFTGNTYESNIQYGLDPHDDSDYLTIDRNLFQDNGNHGMICSVYCNNLVVTNNQSYRNLHGIMIHRNVDGAIITGNTSADNRDAGIAIFDSHDAVVRNNTVTNNGGAAVRLSVGASRNLIEDNKLTGLAANATGNGYVVYTYKGSDPPTSGDGRPKQNTIRNNHIVGYKSQVLKIGEGTDNHFEGNTISGPSTATAFDFSNGVGNVVANNRFGSTLSTHINTQGSSTLAATTVVRNSEVGKRLTLKLNSYASTTLQDSANRIWLLPETTLTTQAGASNTTLPLTYAQVGSSEAVTTLDFAVKPSNGTVAVKPITWQTSAPYSKTWTESSSTTTGSVAHTVGNLQAGACYGVIANSTSIGRFIADSKGQISFPYIGGYSGTIPFAVEQSTGCGG